MKNKKTIAEPLSQKELGLVLQERRRKKRLVNERWRRKHPDVNRAIYLRYFKKKREQGLVYKTGRGWIKKPRGN